MKNNFYQSCSVFGLSLLLIVATLFSVQARAELISTDSSVQTQHEYYTKQQVLNALDSAELKQQLAEQGIDSEVVKAKVATLTPEEISELNLKLQEEPAGAGVVGVIAFVFVVLIVTDIFCVTDVFSFVNCI